MSQQSRTGSLLSSSLSPKQLERYSIAALLIAASLTCTLLGVTALPVVILGFLLERAIRLYVRLWAANLEGAVEGDIAKKLNLLKNRYQSFQHYTIPIAGMVTLLSYLFTALCFDTTPNLMEVHQLHIADYLTSDHVIATTLLALMLFCLARVGSLYLDVRKTHAKSGAFSLGETTLTYTNTPFPGMQAWLGELKQHRRQTYHRFARRLYSLTIALISYALLAPFSALMMATGEANYLYITMLAILSVKLCFQMIVHHHFRTQEKIAKDSGHAGGATLAATFENTAAAEGLSAQHPPAQSKTRAAGASPPEEEREKTHPDPA